MAKSKIKIEGNSEKEMLDSLFDQCSNNNQICYHLKKNTSLILFLKKKTKLSIENTIQLLYHYKEEISNIPKCLCGKNRKYHCWGYRPTCGNKRCINIERENSKRQFCLDNYGVEYVTQLDSMKEKSKKTILDKYGVDNITKLPEVIKKRKENNKKKWGLRILYQCNISIGSNGEQEVYDYISSIYKGKISRSNRKLISPYEIDIVLQDLKLCIEFNGDYWHSTKVNDDPDYHLNKTIRCIELGYDLLQIRENDWNLNKDQIKKKLFNRINNIYDSTDLNIDGDYLIFDMSWYDSRILEDLKGVSYEFIEPKLIDCGQYKQWNCGFKVFKIF